MSETGSTANGQGDGTPGRPGWRLPVLAMLVSAIVVIAAYVFRSQTYVTYMEPAESMTPTLNPDAQILVHTGTADDVRRGDIIVFTTESWQGHDAEVPLVKRVVGIGGDTVSCCDAQGRLQVNGRSIDEDYLRQDDSLPDLGSFTASVPAETVFVLGDWRNNSVDSRLYVHQPDHGAIPLSAIEGTVVASNGDFLTPTQAFTQAGLPGEPFQDNRLDRIYLILIIAGAAVFLVGWVWLVRNLVVRAHPRRDGRRPRESGRSAVSSRPR